MGNCSSEWKEVLGNNQNSGASAIAGSAVGPNIRDAPAPSTSPPTIKLDEKVARFDNLPGKDIEALWRTFSSTQSSFALTKTDLIQIMSVIKDSIGGSDPQNVFAEASRVTGDLFDYWVKLNNEYATNSKFVDAMEIIMALMFTSKMPLEDKVNFLFDCIDFDGENHLDFDELAISLRSIEGGLARLRGKTPVAHQKVIELVREWFPEVDQNDPSKQLTRERFTEFCLQEGGVARQVFQLFAEAEGESGSPVEEELTRSKVTPRLEGGGDEFMAIKPWKGAIHAPSAKVTDDPTSPQSHLVLEWIHGYRVGLDETFNDGRCIPQFNNVRYVPGKYRRIAYNAAAVGVVMELVDGRDQSFFLEHRDDVISIAVGVLNGEPRIATGEIGKKPRIEVWDPDSLKPICSLEGFHKGGIGQLTFSKDGKLLVSVGQDDDHSVAVFNVENDFKGGRMVCSAKGPKQPVICLAWNPYYEKSKSKVRFVTCGVKNLDFWTMDDSGRLTSQKAIFQSSKIITFFSVAFLPADGNVVVGTSAGGFYLFNGREFAREIPPADESGGGAHAGPVFAMTNALCDDMVQCIISGGKDGKVILWPDLKSVKASNDEVKKKVVLDVAELTKDSIVSRKGDRGIRSVQVEYFKYQDENGRPAKEHRILLGTQDSEVYEAVRTSPDKWELVQKPWVRGHYKDEVWGLSTHPSKPQYCTVGDDQTLRIWCLNLHQQIGSFRLNGPARACAYSPDGSMIAVGFGSGAKEKNRVDGTVRIYGFEVEEGGKTQSILEYRKGAKLTLKHEAKDAREWISDIKFTPDGKTLAVGSHDNCVYLYSTFQKFKKRAKFNKHNSYITHIDFSNDGHYMQTNCGAYELLFSDVTTAKQIGASSSLRDVQWSTWTCTLGWPVQGIWPPCSDGTDINAVDRSKGGQLIATADDFGKVKLFRYPCLTTKAQCHVSVGHSSHVTNVRWADQDNYLVSLGGNDRCVFEWRHDKAGLDDDKDGARSSKRQKRGETDEVRRALADEGLVPNEKENPPAAEMASTDPDEVVDMPLGGDEFMAVKPWLGAIVEPTKPNNEKKWDLDSQLKNVLKKQAAIRKEGFDTKDPKKLENLQTESKRVSELIHRTMRGDNGSAPDDDGLSLEWVHGYRCDDCRNNVRYNKDDDIVYHAAAVGVVLSATPKGERKQRFNVVHTDDIISFAMHPSEEIVATGQIGAKPKIQVWSLGCKGGKGAVSKPMEVKATLQGFHKRGVSLLQFSRDGALLLSVGQDDDHSIALYEWVTDTLRGTAKGDRNPVMAIDFFPNSSDFLSCGAKHIKFWTRQGLNLSSKQVSCSNKADMSFTTIGWMDYVTSGGDKPCELGRYNYALLGTMGGNEPGELVVVDLTGDKITICNRRFRVHQEAIYAMHTKKPRIEDGRVIEAVITGSKDGRIVIWTPNENDKGMPHVMATIEVNKVCKALDPAVRSVQMSRDDQKILFGTLSSEIFEVRASQSSQAPPALPLIQGHYKDEIWGLAVHPSKREYCTVGDDQTLRVWDVAEKKVIRMKSKLGGMSRACAYSREGTFIAIGLGGSVGKGRQRIGGTIHIYKNEDSLPTDTPVAAKKDAKEWISDIKFSPDGKTIAAGSHDNCVYLYSFDENTAALQLRTKFNRHHSYITHLDFSQDSHYMQTNCGAYELLFSSIQTGQQIPKATELRDVQWSTWTCTLGWPVQGIWPPCSDGTDVNAVDRSHAGSLIATGDDFGKVKLFRYPCVQKAAQPQEYLGHSSHVTNVRWTCCDECLISLGGNDKCVFQWYNNVACDAGYSVVEQASPSRRNTLAPTPAMADLDELDEGHATREDDEIGLEAPLDLIKEGLQKPTGGDEFGANRPWLGAIKAPSNYVANGTGCNPRPPQVQLQLEWVHGYSGHTFRSNLYYTSTQEVVYPAAALGVVMKVDRGMSSSDRGGKGDSGSGVRFALPEGPLVHQQNYYHGHTDDIMCLTICPKRRFVASGEKAALADKGKVVKQPEIRIWDTMNCDHMTTLPQFHKFGVVALAFHPTEPRLASVGLEDDHCVAVWKDVGGSWSKITREATSKGDSNLVFFIVWARGGDGDDIYPLVTGGSQHIRFWKLAGNSLVSKKGVFGKVTQPQVLLCATNFAMDGEWRLVTGASSGEILVWKGRECLLSRPAHDKAINCVMAVGSLEEGNEMPDAESSRLVTGGKDGKVKVWNSALESIQEYDISTFRNTVEPSIRALDLIPAPTKNTKGLNIVRILVGTQGAEVFEIATDQRHFDTSLAPLVQGHYQDELWGLDILPITEKTRNLVATSGDDGTVRLWSMDEKRMVGKYLLPKRRKQAEKKKPTTEGASNEVGKNKVGSRSNKSAAPEESASRYMSRAVACDPSGQWLAVGLGGDVGKTKSERFGGHVLLSLENKQGRIDMQQVGPVQDLREWVSDIKWVPTESQFQLYAVASHDNNIYIYAAPPLSAYNKDDTARAPTPLKNLILQGHTAYIRHLDFAFPTTRISNNSEVAEVYLQSVCGGYELLFWKVDMTNQKYSRVTKAAETRDVNWSSWTCILGWPVQGIFTGNMDGSDVNAVCRIDGPTPYLAVAGDDGKVKLYNYPCISTNAQAVEGCGHSSHVTNVRYPMVMPSDLRAGNATNRLMTTGGNDKCLFQWRVVPT